MTEGISKIQSKCSSFFNKKNLTKHFVFIIQQLNNRLIVCWSYQSLIKKQNILQSSQSNRMSSEQLGLLYSNDLYKEPPANQPHLDKIEEEEDKLIRAQVEPETASQSQSNPPPEEEAGEQLIDPIEQLVKHNDIVPLLAVLHLIDLDTLIDGKPLLNKLCTMNIPLAQHLKGREIVFKTDADNRTALHQAIAADDTAAANWCLQNGIGNIRDNFGNTPILQAIKYGRKSCFLLCLHYDYVDRHAPHLCATYNRVWELKVLYRLGYDIITVKDEEYFTPIERAAANYSYDAAEYLSETMDRLSDGYLSYISKKTDSKGIIRLMKRARKINGFGPQVARTILLLFLQLAVIYLCVWQPGGLLPELSFYQPYQPVISKAIGGLLALHVIMVVIGCSKKTELNRRDINFLALLKAPEFPTMEDICPECLVPQDRLKDHCRKCGRCVQGFHFHNIACVNRKNEVFWFFIEVFWFFLLHNLQNILLTHLKLNNLLILNFSSNFFFEFATIVDELISSSQWATLGWFLFLKVFLIYQFFCLFQWLAMMVLYRTHREINNTEKYKRLYRVVKTTDGNYKHQEIKLLEDGLVTGTIVAVVRVLRYFLCR